MRLKMRSLNTRYMLMGIAIDSGAGVYPRYSFAQEGQFERCRGQISTNISDGNN